MRILHGELARLRVAVRPFAISKYLKSAEERKLHLGCGTHSVPGWLNADKFNSNADIWMDAGARWPFAEDALDLIYTEHMLEHIRVDDVPHVLSEAFRVLKPGGGIRISVPDLEIHARNYVEKNDAFFAPIIAKYQARLDKQRNKYWLVRSNGGAFMTRAVQRFFRHRWFYDFETLAGCLKEVGFSRIEKRSFADSLFPSAAKMDTEDRAFESLYVDAIK